MSRAMQVFACAAFAATTSSLKLDSVALQPGSVAAYQSFRQEFAVERPHEDEEAYLGRVALFERRREEVRKHNMQSALGWLQAMNKFADYTDAEFHAMLGYRHSGRSRSADALAPLSSSSFVQSMPQQQLARAMDWRQKLNSSFLAKDQGLCGSCWAVASAGALETHAEIAGHIVPAPEVSFEQLVDCVEDSRECGGACGCGGCTSELAFEYISKHGIGRQQDYKGYQSHGDGKCRPPNHAVLMVKSFVRLPENDQHALLAALNGQGPVVVAADASGWMMYGSGIFKGCGKDAATNHAILMIGYGTDDWAMEDYWLIRNSWGPSWGESGFIRLLRHKVEESYCGAVSYPELGVGCKWRLPGSVCGLCGIQSRPVCGMCGILSDAVYPTGVEIAEVV